MEHGSGRGRRVAGGIAGVVAVAVLMVGCSSDDSGDTGDTGGSEFDRAWQENYCRQLGAWQRVRNSAEHGAGSDAAEEAGDAVVTAARRLSSASYEGAGDGATMLDVTVAALRGDGAAEGRAVEYCATAGFETLTR
ncbi:MULTISPECIES: hypothetical protein [unclassified Streptomyces]|uniref:hypothetical protein n=1 Tax=unclassified Streptomyces TaxID=2593676 RepID=UPI00074AD8B7|nr:MULTISPECIES: hypothetical protein [unclassified Streptomyces]KUL74147.1 hypothetical protein ADL34_18540 [Streptomyces sp. NRRL WC-3605]KUL74916.1 hypothetical protein ADL33_16435 [Streptomyces sp. NRRL WC-3604]